MRNLPVHRCTDAECPVYGQVTTSTCGCHKTTVELLVDQVDDLLAALTELHAMVWGESPSLLNEDSGGCARLDMAIRAAIAKAEGRSNGT